jgi:peptidoglycan/LPS O-acetylase OafA/YrhL
MQTIRSPTFRQPSTALLGLQALAPVSIFTGHWAEGLMQNPLPQGQLGVDFFFAVEGFFAADIIVRTQANFSFLKLIFARVSKIYPLYLLGMLISLALAGILLCFNFVEWPMPVIKQAFLWNTWFLPIFIDPVFVFPINPPTWAIALEIYFYALLCLVRRALSIPRLLVGTGLAAFTCLLVSVLFRDANMGFQPSSYWGGFPRCMFGFLVGMLIYHIVRQQGPVLLSVNPILIWAAFLTVLMLPIHYIGLPLLFFVMPFIVWLGAVAKNPTWLRGIAVQAGRLAYALYLLSYPILIALHHLRGWLGNPQTPQELLVDYLLTLTVIFVIAYAATCALEQNYPKKDLLNITE